MKILVGYDGSETAKAALLMAAKQAQAFEAEIILLSSVTIGSVTEKVEIEHAEQDLAEAAELLTAQSISCKSELKVTEYTPGEIIVDIAKQEKVDLIVIGVRRRSKVGKILFGSNAQYVIIKSHCPVLTVK